jgi:hypothetical protein
MMRLIRGLALAGGLIAGSASLAGILAAETPAPAPSAERRGPAQLTLKERSGGKAGDQQRVNDCKVPFEQRGDHHRPAECASR